MYPPFAATQMVIFSHSLRLTFIFSSFFAELLEAVGDSATLIRVNPEFPYGPSEYNVISILGRAVESIQAIDHAMTNLV